MMEKTRSTVAVTVLTTLEIAFAGLTVYIAIRAILGPDATKTFQMRCAKRTELFCVNQARMWVSLADQAQKVYDHARPVGV